MLYSVSATRSFSAGHVIRDHPQCYRPGHGHAWKVTARAEYAEVDDTGYPRGADGLSAVLDRIVRELHLRNLDEMIPRFITTTTNMAAWFFERLLSLGVKGVVEVEVCNDIDSGRVTATSRA